MGAAVAIREDATDTPDAIEELGDEIAKLAAHLHAATQRLLVLIAEFDRLRGWESDGHRSCAHWLAFRTGIDLGAAREKVRVARALVALPLTSAAMARGELSFSQVRALSRVATPEEEAELLELARGSTTAQLERMVRAWKRGSRKDEPERERERYRSRTFSVFPDDEGMYVVRGLLTPEVGALLMRALEAAGGALFRERALSDALSVSDRDAAQQRADAVGLLAERALAAGFAGDLPISGTRTERYQVMLHVEPRTLSTESQPERFKAHGRRVCAERGRPLVECEPEGYSAGSEAHSPQAGPEAFSARSEPEAFLAGTEPDAVSADGEPGCAELEDGTRVSAETCRRLSCDASVVRVERAKTSAVLNVGRKTRTISTALRRALEARDRGCRFPGCGLRFTDAHHVVHWADGGETSLANCMLLCGYHHMLVHEGGWRLQWWGAGRPVFIDPRGGEHFDGGWRPPVLPDQPVTALLHENRRLGANPDPWTAGAHWNRGT